MNYLEMLGVHPRVQHFFNPYLTISCETLIFNYGNFIELASEAFHRILITEELWIAGDPKFATNIFISSSAMDAIAFLNLYHQRFRKFDSLCFIGIGTAPSKSHAEIIQKYKLKKLHFIFSNNPLGAICDLKLASYIRNKPLKIGYHDYKFQLTFENKFYAFEQLSLNALEKASGYNFLIRTHKPKNTSTYYEQLSNRHPA